MKKQLVEDHSVYKLELSAVEVLVHYVADIELYESYQSHNQTPVRGNKKRMTITDEMADIDSTFTLIRYALAA